jgi:hypothetical protein
MSCKTIILIIVSVLPPVIKSEKFCDLFDRFSNGIFTLHKDRLLRKLRT